MTTQNNTKIRIGLGIEIEPTTKKHPLTDNLYKDYEIKNKMDTQK